MSDSDIDAEAQPRLFKKAKVDPVAAAAAEPWIEKYRPRTLDDVQAQREAVDALRRTVSAGAHMPHLLFHGPAGVGKTSAVLAAAYELFGPDMLRQRVRELNASDERGIAVVRDKVKSFAQGAVGSAPQRVQSDGKTYPVPPFKLIILDEADALLPDAQAALRRMMEDFSEVTRFCILCNYVSRIIDPITSRCAKFRFKPLTDEVLRSRMRHIAEREGIQTSDACLERLDAAAGGDMRLAIMHLQAATRAHGTDLRNEDFIAVAGIVPEDRMRAYVGLLASPTASFDDMYAATAALVREGYSGGTVLQQVHAFVVSRECTFADKRRSHLVLHISKIERRLMDRGDDFMQLASLAGKFFETRGEV
jgi:replication factor C subunit 2/4